MSTVSGNTMSGMQGSDGEAMGHGLIGHAMFSQFEGRTNGADNELRWDGEGWLGTDMNRLRVKSEAYGDGGGVSDGDHEALYGRPIPRLRYFDAQAGIRADLDSGPARAWAAIGVEGLAPYFFAFAPTLYIRNDGRVAGRLEGSYDLLLTQRWIAEPEAELNFYSKDDAPRGIGSGLSEMDTGIRVRYEVSRKFAPYLGFAWDGKFGGTVSYARQRGETSSDPRFVFGIRFWY
ncbi:copper resistance protein B [Paracidobacterium acidisoli]|nr:copper resistance protein B [Paracidobacterium acidisoli]